MMVLTQLQGTSTPLINRIDKLVVRPEGETAEAEPAFIDKELNETIGPNQPAHQPPAWGDEIKVYDPEKLAGLTPSSGARNQTRRNYCKRAIKCGGCMDWLELPSLCRRSSECCSR